MYIKMINNRVLMYVGLMLIVFGFPAISAGSEKNDVVIIVGKPYKVKDSDEEVHFDKVTIGSKYIAYFKDYKIVSGNFKKRNILKVKLIASSGSIVTHPDEIYVVFKNSTEKALEAWTWGVPQYSVCLPENSIKELGLDDEFGKFVFNTGRRCRGIYEHQKMTGTGQ
jgi:hypothetical protein